MKRTKNILLIWVAMMILSSGCNHQGQIITTASLLSEMTDREQLAYFPEQEYTCKQFSSYNQTSTEPGYFTWFANLVIIISSGQRRITGEESSCYLTLTDPEP